MSTTLNIPLTTLTVGVHTFGPATVATSDTSAVLSINRNVTGGLNSTPTVTFDTNFQYSTDSGVTWQFLAGSTGSSGGIDTKNPNVWTLGANLPGVAFELQGSITIHTTSVAVSGSVVLS